MPRQLSLLLGLSYVVTLTCGVTMGMLALSGCGGDDNGDDSAGSDDAAGQSSNRSSNGSRENGSLARTGPYVDDNNRKWVAPGIPYDVWYQNPLQVAALEGNAATIPSSNGGAESISESPAAAGDTTAGTDGGKNWKDVVSGQDLDDEVKKITNRFRANLQTLASYNSSYLELPPHVATMAALAAIASEHPEDIRWKENAGQIRDLSASMLAEKLMRGAKSYKQVNDPFLQISDILRGSPPPGLPEPAEGNDMSQFAEFGLLMKRLDIGSKWLQVNVGTADALKENGEDIKHEAGVLAALATAITTEGYGFDFDDEFCGYAQGLVDGCKKMTDAVNTGSFENYQLGFSQINQACDKCHGTYK